MTAVPPSTRALGYPGRQSLLDALMQQTMQNAHSLAGFGGQASMAQQVAYPQAEPYCTSAADAMTCVESYQQTQLYRALEAQAKAAAVAAKMTEVRQRKEKAKMADNDIIPDISLARVFKWAVVLIVVMFLGKRVWDMFGDKVTAQLHKALGDNKPAA